MKEKNIAAIIQSIFVALLVISKFISSHLRKAAILALLHARMHACHDATCANLSIVAVTASFLDCSILQDTF
jgi:predicted membrane protein